MNERLYGGIEFGGTKTVCAVGRADGTIVSQDIFVTTDVDETLATAYKFFDTAEPVAGLGIGAFGPIDLNSSSENYGSIYNSPKPGWENVALRAQLAAHFKVPIFIESDVNCAAIGELYYGAAQDVSNFLYLTLGTGIGGSLILDKQIIHGTNSIEMGHIRIPHEPYEGDFQGSCVFHGDCLEGIASGFAMQQRYGQRAEQISDATAWNTEAAYIGEAVYNIMMMLGPEKIVLGGGLVNHAGLVEVVREVVKTRLNNYTRFSDLDSGIAVSSGNSNGVRGAIRLASEHNLM